MAPDRKSLRSVLVTGASGFIGRHLCRHLQQQGIRIRALSRHEAPGPWDEYCAVALGEGALAPAHLRGVDTVVHLAGYAHAVNDLDSARIHKQVTVAGTRELLALLDPATQQMLFVSSVKAQPTTAAAEPDSDYGKARQAAEQQVQAFHAQRGGRTLVLRLPLVYGPGVKGNLRRMFEAIERGRFPPLPEFGNRRSMIHVEDVCTAIPQALRTGISGGCYTLTDGREYSSREIYLALRKALGKPPPHFSVPVLVFKFLARSGDLLGALAGRRLGFDSEALDKLAGDALYDNQRAVTDFGFQPRHDFESALTEMLSHWRETGR